MHRKWKNHEQLGKHIIQCFRHATYQKFIFNMEYDGACECDPMPFLSRPVLKR